MDTTENRARLIAACDTTVVVSNAATRAHRRARLERASQTADLRGHRLFDNGL